MPKQKIEIEVDVPEGSEAYIHEVEPGVYGPSIRIRSRHAWQWPAWTNLNWLAMDRCGAWSLYENEPEIELGRTGSGFE